MDVKLHDIGEGMTEAEVLKIFVKVGDEVTLNEPVVEVQTDKMVAELSAPEAGKITKIRVSEGDTVSVGDTLIEINGAEQAQPKTAPEAQPEITAPIKTAQKRVLATPYTRRIARENAIDLSEVPASDKSGRISEQDVYAYIAKQQVPQTTTPPAIAKTEMVAGERIPFKGVRKKIAEHLTHSLFTIPHVTHFEEIDMTALVALRNELKEEGESIRYAAFLYKAITIALKKFPIFNALLDEENNEIILRDEYHLGLATNTEDGLIVPVLHNADTYSLKALDERIATITERALTKKLTMAEMQNSSFTISNVGPLGSIGATPIINYPETALIALHQMKKRPIVNANDEIVVGYMMNVSMTFDHRVADGATAIAFTNELKRLIERPKTLFLEMM